jgi:3-methyladenine DNA glycosylase AlkC
MAEILLETLSRLSDNAPDITLPADIDLAALKKVDPDPMFVVLPIGKVDVTSGNNRKYTRAAVLDMVDSVNRDRPEGIQGHMKDDERAYRYDLPSVRWVAAKLDANGVAWGKALVLNEPTKQYFNIAKATGAKVGTSLYGTAEMNGNEVTKLYLESIDIAHPMRVGVPEAASKVSITTEMTDKVTAETSAFMRKTIAEQATAFMNVSVAVNASGDDLVETLQKLISQLTALQTNMPVNLAVEEALHLEDVPRGLRPILRELVGNPPHTADARLKVYRTMRSDGMTRARMEFEKIEADKANEIAKRYDLDTWRI